MEFVDGIKAGGYNIFLCSLNTYDTNCNANIFYKNNKDVIKKINRLIAIYPKAENDCNFSPAKRCINSSSNET